MSELDLRIVRPGDDSDEGMLADVSAPLWRLWVVFDGTEDAKAIAAFFGELNEGQRNLLAVAIVRSEIANGGIDQFFLESTGRIWPQALAGLRAIKAENYVKLLERVLALFPDRQAPIMTSDRSEFLLSLPDNKTEALFESLNGKWDELDSSEKHSLAAFCSRYIISNPEYFFLQ